MYKSSNVTQHVRVQENDLIPGCNHLLQISKDTKLHHEEQT